MLCVAYGHFTATEVLQYVPWQRPSSVHTTISKLKRAGVVIDAPADVAAPAEDAPKCCPECGQRLPGEPARTTRGPEARLLTLREDILKELDEWYTEARVDEWLTHLTQLQEAG